MKVEMGSLRLAGLAILGVQRYLGECGAYMSDLARRGPGAKRLPKTKTMRAVEAGRLRVDGEWFGVAGSSSHRLALVGPDGIVYKVSRDGGFEFRLELETFQRLEEHGVSWCPDYWPFPENVMAMKRYTACDFLTMTPEQHEQQARIMATIHGDMNRGNFGIDEAGTVFLLDGGCRFSLDAHEAILRGELIPDVRTPGLQPETRTYLMERQEQRQREGVK